MKPAKPLHDVFLLTSTMEFVNMKYCKPILVLLASLTHYFGASAQKISYSEPEREDNKRTNFDIIGKVGGNFLVFKNNRSDNNISVYDNEMKLVKRVNVNPENERWINVDFVADAARSEVTPDVAPDGMPPAGCTCHTTRAAAGASTRGRRCQELLADT